MRSDIIVVFEEFCHAVESWIVRLEGLEETFDLAPRGPFSSGTGDMLYSLLGTEACESAWPSLLRCCAS